MTFRQGFSSGIRGYSEAFHFIKKNGLSWYFLFPLVLNIILLALGFSAFFSMADQLADSIRTGLDMESWDFWASGVIIYLLEGLIYILANILFLVLFTYSAGYIVIILLSPVFSILSEKTSAIINNTDYPFDFNQFTRDIIRGIRLASRNFLIEMGLTLALLIFSIIPFMGIIASIILFIISSYFYGFSFIDYSLERRKIGLTQSIQFVRSNRGMAIGNGSIFSLFLIIPYIGVLLSGFASILAVVAATIATEKAFSENNQLSDL